MLKGLHSISPSYHYNLNELTQLDNINKKYIDQELKAEQLPIVTGHFVLEKKDKDQLLESFSETKPKIEEVKVENTSKAGDTSSIAPELDEVVQSLVDADEIEITKFIDESYSITFGKRTLKSPISLATMVEIKNLVSKMMDDLPVEFNTDPNHPHKPAFDSACNKILDLLPDDNYDLPDKTIVMEEINKLKNLPVSSPLKEKLQKRITRMEKLLEHYPSPEEIELPSFLLELMPRTVYFKDYDALEDVVTLTELKENPEGHMTFLNVLKLADVRIESLQRIKDDSSRLQQYLQNASGAVSTKLRGAWGQETFDLQIRYADGKLMVFTADPLQPGILLPPSYGSEGFQWYLRFFINFAVATNSEYKDALLLLDDPGVLLHPTGHKDLMKRFHDYLKDDVRTMYSTHLPSLIPKDSISSIRVLVKKGGTTQVIENFWKLDNTDAWAPIRASLGIDLTDSFFLGTETIMVEGPSDVIYLQGLFKILRVLNKTVSLGFVLPLTGVNNVEYFAKLFDTQALPYIAVIDKSSQSYDLKDERVLEIVPKHKGREGQDTFDIEDLVENELLANGFIRTHSGFDIDFIRGKLNASGKKVVTVLTECLKNAGKSKDDLDKVGIAKEVVKMVKENPKQFLKTIENFEILLQKIEEKFKELS